MASKGYTQEHTIAASPEAVFAVLADLKQAKEWMPDVTAIEQLFEGELGQGSKWVETRRTPRGPFVSTIEVTEFTPSETLALRAANRKAELTFRFTLFPVDAGTKVSVQAGGRLKGLMAPFSGRLVKEMQEADKDLLQRLEAQVAKQAPAKPAAKAVGKAAKSTKAAKAPAKAKKASVKAA